MQPQPQEDINRYYYDPRDRVMVDTATGKVYRFMVLKGKLRQVEVDYVNGTVKPLQTIHEDSKEMLILSDYT